MTRISDQIADQAVAWHLRQEAMDAADWHRFVEWLEADPRHGAAFDRLAMADGALADAGPLVLPTPANDRGAPGWRPSYWIGGAVACAAAAAAVFMVLPARPDIQTIQTAAGETRQLALADGSRIEIAGGSRLRIDRAQPRQVVVEAGEALFHVRHDAADPFIVRSGNLEVQDVGTVFNIVRDGSRFSVAVAEGSVLFQPRGEAVTLTAGATLQVREDRQEVQLGKVDPVLVGGWRSGRLSFSDTPVSEILSEIERLYGTRLVAEGGLSTRKVTGMITLSGEARRDVPHIASLIGANWRADGGRWVLSPGDKNRP